MSPMLFALFGVLGTWMLLLVFAMFTSRQAEKGNITSTFSEVDHAPRTSHRERQKAAKEIQAIMEDIF